MCCRNIAKSMFILNTNTMRLKIYIHYGLRVRKKRGMLSPWSRPMLCMSGFGYEICHVLVILVSEKHNPLLGIQKCTDRAPGNDTHCAASFHFNFRKISPPVFEAEWNLQQFSISTVRQIPVKIIGTDFSYFVLF